MKAKNLGRKFSFTTLTMVAVAASCGASSTRLPIVTCPNLDSSNLAFEWAADRGTCDNSGTPHLIAFVDVLQSLRHGPDLYAHEMAIVSIEYVDQRWDEVSDAGDNRIPNGANVRLMSGAHATKVSVQVDEVTYYYCFTPGSGGQGNPGTVTAVNQ